MGFKRESKNFTMAVKIFTMLNAVKPTHYLTLQGRVIKGRVTMVTMSFSYLVTIIVRPRFTGMSTYRAPHYLILL